MIAPVSRVDVERWVAPGAVTAILDPRGTVATQLLAALLAPPAGEGGEWSLAGRHHVCFVPEGAPVLAHRSALANVRRLCAFSGVSGLEDSTITHALRVADLPDHHLRTAGASLGRLERLAIWLAVHQLRRCHTLVVADPTSGLTQGAISSVVRLLQEATANASAVIVTTPDATVGTALTERLFRVDEDLLA